MIRILGHTSCLVPLWFSEKGIYDSVEEAALALVEVATNLNVNRRGFGI